MNSYWRAFHLWIFSAKLMPTFADTGCHVVSTTDPYGRILDFVVIYYCFCDLVTYKFPFFLFGHEPHNDIKFVEKYLTTCIGRQIITSQNSKSVNNWLYFGCQDTVMRNRGTTWHVICPNWSVLPILFTKWHLLKLLSSICTKLHNMNVIIYLKMFIYGIMVLWQELQF
jgi:hypothetical protein